jgi:alanine racemase
MRAILEPRARFCAVVKANAYGHGLKEVVTIANRAGVDAYAVDDIDDALYLQEIFPSALIIVLGYTMFDRFKEAINAGIHLTLYDKEGIEWAQKVGSELAKTINVHLKIETGTQRQGASLDDLPDLAQQFLRSPYVKLEGLSTHFANIEDADTSDFAAQQFTLLGQGAETLASYGLVPTYRHCACSAAIILYPQTHQTLVRAGISMYGLWPSESVQNTARKLNMNLDLVPVMTWKTIVAQIKNVSMGTPVGYGLTEKIKRSGRIAVLPVGYFDGYRRSLSSIGEVLLRGQRCKIIGRVCMNMMMVDVSDVPSVAKEDEVILLGTDGRHRISAEDIAQKSSTVNYEVIAQINRGLPRIIV